jgi:uncharacterized membrane protein
MSFLQFYGVENPDRKTKRWIIRSTRNPGSILGWIEFHAPWRKYIWSMAHGVIFDIGCTEEVVEFLKLHKDDRQ